MIKISNLTKVFHTPSGDVTALKDVSIHIEKGDIFGIIGMSGAGKSTLLRCMGMLEKPTSGAIYLDEKDTKNLKAKEISELKKKIGVIFQGYNLLMQRSVFENVAFPLELVKYPKSEIKPKVEKLLEVVGLLDKANAYPSQLSGGQKQRVAIARALANDPEVILCDEPTSALDSLTTKSILTLLKDINKKLNVTVVIITHEIGVVKATCNKVAVIDSNSIVETGSVKEIFEQPKSEVTKLLLGIGGDL